MTLFVHSIKVKSLQASNIFCLPADGVADVVLSCSLVEEGVGMGGMGSGALFTRTQATLVLRDVPVGPDESLDTLTPFVPPSVPDPDLILFENKGVFLSFLTH